MSEMIERVAEALMKSRHPDAPLTYAEVVMAVSLGSDPTVLEGFRRDARAAIEAMREPTEEMAEAGRWPAEDDGPVECWTAMIDEILTTTARVSDEQSKTEDRNGLSLQGASAVGKAETPSPFFHLPIEKE